MPNPDGSRTYAEKQNEERSAADAQYMQAFNTWKQAAAIEAHGGPPAGPKPVYNGPTNLIEPNSATNVASTPNAGSSLDPNHLGAPPQTAFSDGHAPVQHITEPDGAGAAPPAGVGGAPALSTGERAGYSLDDAQGQQIRGRQVSYLDALTARANGQGPSVAAELANQQQSTIARNALGMAAQARGADAAAARRAAIQGIAQVGGQAAQQAGLLRAQEQTQAQDQLGQQLFGVRGQDTGVATHMADQTLGATTGNLDRESGERIAGGAQATQREGIAAGERSNRYAADRGVSNQPPWWLGPLVQGGTTLGAAAITKSDERAKTNIADAGPADWLDHLVAKDYDYKDPADGPGRRRGVMAQDLEKSDVGKAFVIDGADGIKRVDTGGLTLALVAEVARMRRELKGKN